MVQAFCHSAQPNWESIPHLGIVPRSMMARSMTAPHQKSSHAVANSPNFPNHPIVPRIQQAIVRIDETLAILESPSSPAKTRWQVNRVQVQLQDLDQLLNDAIALLQVPESSNLCLPVSTLDLIHRLLNQLTDAFTRLEGWHNIH